MFPVNCSPDRRPPVSLRHLLVRAGRQAGHGFRLALAPLDLDPRQFLLLRTVDAMAGCSQQAIGARAEIPPSRVVALVDELERRQLLQRVPNPQDRRAYSLLLTPAGKRLLTRAQAAADTHEAQLGADLDEAERETLVSLLGRLDAHLEHEHGHSHEHDPDHDRHHDARPGGGRRRVRRGG